MISRLALANRQVHQRARRAPKESIAAYLLRGGKITYSCLCGFQYRVDKAILDEYKSFICPKCGNEMMF